MSNLYICPEEKVLLAAFDDARGRQCTESSWVLFSVDVAGAGGMITFDSKAELIDFLYRFPFLFGSIELGESELEAAEVIRQIVQLWRNREISALAITTIVNAIRGHVEKICWMGSVEALLIGGDEFAIDVRKEFLDKPEDTSVGSEITVDRVQEFLEYLSEWGA